MLVEGSSFLQEQKNQDVNAIEWHGPFSNNF